MNKKQTLSSLLILLLAFILVACGKENGAPGASVFSPSPTEAASAPDRLKTLAETTPIKDIVTVGSYKGVKASLLDLTVTEQELERELYLSLADYVIETDRTVIERYDMANINFEGKIDGVAFDGGTADSYSLLIGSSRFIPGFEDGLLGVSVGETVELNLTFPETYGNTALAGKDVVFTVTVNSIKEFPELTDAFIAEKTESETLSDYQEFLRKSLQDSYDARIDAQFENDILTAIVEDSEFHMDLSAEINNTSRNIQSMYEANAQRYGVSLEVYVNAMLGISLNKFLEELPQSAEQIIKRNYALLAVADAEGMTVTDEEYENYTFEIMVNYGYETMDALEADYPRKNLEHSILYDRALDFVLSHAERMQ